MATFSNLPGELVEKIFSRVPMASLRSVRSTCKRWEAISKNQILGEAVGSARNQFLGFMLIDFTMCSMKFDLQGIRNDGDDLIDQSIKEVEIVDGYSISQVHHCDGLLLCVLKRKDDRVMVWNMYLGQKRWIRPSGIFKKFIHRGFYALGYAASNNKRDRNHKMLREKGVGGVYEIYDFNSCSWRVLNDVTLNRGILLDREIGLSLKGNAYFLPKEEFPYIFPGDPEEGVPARDVIGTRLILLCFDFTRETFGPPLPLPFYAAGNAALSCVRGDQLAVLYQHYNTIDIWISTHIHPNAASWNKFLHVDFMPPDFTAGNFFVDEDKQVALVFDQTTDTAPNHAKAYIIGEDGYFKSLNIGDAPPEYRLPLVSTSYVPSLVQLNINNKGKRKHRDYSSCIIPF